MTAAPRCDFSRLAPPSALLEELESSLRGSHARYHTPYMTRGELLRFIRGYSLAVQASMSAFDAPQAAVVGIGVTDEFEIFFDTLDATRKANNLRQNPKIALSVG